MLLISGIGFISYSATFISTSQKEVIRDSKRLNDLTVLRKAIEDYKTKNGYYPKLESGTNIKGYVNSVWPSQWTSFCNLVGLSSCPIDPINEIVGCDCSVFGVCTGTNLNSNIDTTSCYNSKAQSFACTAGSNLYQYQSLNNGRNYSLMMEFEYSSNVNWNVDSSASDNYIVVKDTCKIGSNLQAKILSNAIPKCGDGILNYSEVCEVGSKKTEYCNIDNKLGRKVVNCTSSCTWESNPTSSCITGKFCGDGVVDTNEECDGGSQKMCFNFDENSKHDWHTEQLRYCGLNCKWDRKLIDSLAYCGGYCGDGVVQSESGEECDNKNEKHCNMNSCKYENSAPNVNFDFYSDRISNNSYIKSDVWSGDKLQYQNHYYDTSFVDLVIASKQKDKYVAVWNSDFIEIKVGATDKDGDNLKYKYKINSAFNSNVQLKYYVGSEWVNYINGSLVSSDVVRIYPKLVSGGSNLKNTLDISNPYNGDLLFGSSFVGGYSLNVVVSDGYGLGQNSSTNQYDASDSYDIKFNIGPGCGDGIVQKDLGEFCEWRPGVTINSIMIDWGTYLDSANRRFRQPDNTGNCIVQIFQNKVGALTFNTPGKVDDVDCSRQYFGLCEKRTHLGCDSSWIKGAEDNCYKLTSKSETWQEAYNECFSYGSHLVTYTDTKETDFIKNQSFFVSKNMLWIGNYKENGFWKEVTGAKMTVIHPNIGSGVFSGKIFDGGLGASLADEYYCGLPWDFNACTDDRGYCGDGTSNPQFKSCEPSSDTYSYYNKDVSVSVYGAPDSSYSFQYFCPNPNGKYGKIKLCESFNGYCGDGVIQYDLDKDADVQKGEHDTTPIVVSQLHPEQCDPNGHSATAKESSINNTYKCGSAETEDACRDLMYSQKDSEGNYGGYCGDGFVQYSLVLESDIFENVSSNHLLFQTKTDGDPEQCDPKNHSVVSSESSSSNQYYCGAASTVNACKDINGWCGDGVIQYDLTKTADTQKGEHDVASIVVDAVHVEQCDPNGHSATAKESSINNTYTCGSFKTADACKDLIYSQKDSNNNYGGYCGDSKIQYDLTKPAVSQKDPIELADITVDATHPEQCDPNSYSVLMKDTSINSQYACGSAGTVNACKDVSGWCGDGIMQKEFGEICVYTSPTTRDVVNNNIVIAGLTNLTCTPICGTTGDGWTCDAGYYWNDVIGKCVPVPANSVKAGTLHGGDYCICNSGYYLNSINYSPNPNSIGLNECIFVPANAAAFSVVHTRDNYICNAGFEKDGIGGCKACDIGFYTLGIDPDQTCTACTKKAGNQKYTTNSTSDNCSFVNCPVGQYPDTHKTCDWCNNKTNTQYYTSNANVIGSCAKQECPIGQYPNADNISCSACASIANSSWTANGSSTNSCGFNCNAGYYDKDDSTKTSFASGGNDCDGKCGNGIVSIGEQCDRDTSQSLLVRFEGDNRDYSGNNKNGVYTGTGSMQFAAGKYDKSGSFDGDDSVTFNNVNINTAAGAKNTVAFWMYWNGADGAMPASVGNSYDLYLASGTFGFNTGSSDLIGIDFPAATYQNTWVYVVGVFYNGVPSSINNELYINGIKQNISQKFGVTTRNVSATNSIMVSGWNTESGYKFRGMIDDFRVYNKALNQIEINDIYANQSGDKYCNNCMLNSCVYSAWNSQYCAPDDLGDDDLDGQIIATRTVNAGNTAECISTYSAKISECKYCNSPTNTFAWQDVNVSDRSGCSNHGTRYEKYVCSGQSNTPINGNIGNRVIDSGTYGDCACDTDYVLSGGTCVLRNCSFPADYDYKYQSCYSNSFWDTYYSKKTTSNCVVPYIEDYAYTSTYGANDILWCNHINLPAGSDCALVGDISAHACEYCTSNGSVNDTSGCNYRGTRTGSYSCVNNNKEYSSTWGACSCNGDYYGTYCGSVCVYGGWYESNRECQADDNWYITYSRSISGSNCTGGPTMKAATGGRCSVYCPAGTYDNDNDSATACVACPAGIHCSQGAYTVSFYGDYCTSNYFISDYCINMIPIASFPANPCPVGTYDDDNNPTTACVACPAGMHCSQGAYTLSSGYCDSVNSYYSSLCINMRPCPSMGGYNCPAGSSSISMLCPAGTYDDDNNSYTACVACPAGMYCSQGAYNNTIGSSYYCSSKYYYSSNNCINMRLCPSGVGYNCPAGSSVPTLCPAGTYDDDSDSTTACVACPAGMYCSQGAYVFSGYSSYYCTSNNYYSFICINMVPVSSIPTLCPAGTYDDDYNSSTPCVTCPAGMYCSLGAYDNSGNNWCATYGSSYHGNNCINMRACSYTGEGGGYYCPAGSSVSTICPAGTYDNDNNSTTPCVTCPVGIYCSRGAYNNYYGYGDWKCSSVNYYDSNSCVNMTPCPSSGGTYCSAGSGPAN